MYRREIILGFPTVFLAKKEGSPKTSLPMIVDWLQEAKTIHQDWIQYLEAEEEGDRKKIEFYVGEVSYHRSWVERYSEAIKELEKLG